jgi:pyruvate dehydrogenase E2 component (dihydrolipoamide acetyltransferase)
MGIDWTKLKGSGRHGRVRERDVRSALASHQRQTAEEVLPFSALRRRSAEHLVKSIQNTAPVTLTTTAIVSNLIALRRQFQSATPPGDLAPSLTDFFVKLTGLALVRHPLLAARWSEDHLVIAREINIGIAVHTDAGLLVPVVRQVPDLQIRELASLSRSLIERAHQGILTTKEMEGGVFTITNLGMFGIDAFTPIINHPQCAILGIGRIRRVPAFVGDQVTAQDQVTLSLTFDHRIVDGVPAAQFLQSLTQALENPGPWLMA